MLRWVSSGNAGQMLLHPSTALDTDCRTVLSDCCTVSLHRFPDSGFITYYRLNNLMSLSAVLASSLMSCPLDYHTHAQLLHSDMYGLLAAVHISLAAVMITGISYLQRFGMPFWEMRQHPRCRVCISTTWADMVTEGACSLAQQHQRECTGYIK